MKISAFLMEKNESDLFPVWVGYHQGLCGADNLYVFDNGSDEAMQPALAAAAAQGVNVDTSRKTFADFQAKGDIIAARIKALDASNPSDFYFPLDCDEYVGVKLASGEISFRPEDIRAELEKYRGSPDILRICGAYDNYVVEADKYVLIEGRRKVFFAQDACEWLDIGFHGARTKKAGKEVVTNIVYMHMHFKPFALVQAHARQKLEGRVAGFDRETLIAHRDANKPGHHLVGFLLLENEEAYLKQYRKRYGERAVLVKGFSERLKELGLKLPFAPKPKPPKVKAPAPAPAS